MRLAPDGTLRLSPSDLANHLACAHLTQLQLRVVRGEIERPFVDDPYGQIIMRKGTDHEAAFLARLVAGGKRVARMLTYDDEGFDADEARAATEEAIRAGEADVVYQAYLTDGTWRGFADFLERLPDGTYEPVDTKLARSAKPLHLIQLCFYAEQLERVQGRLPEHIHVELGSGVRETFRTHDFIAFFRRARERLLAAIAAEGQQPTWPWPVYHCTICDFRHLCAEQRVAEDHPITVAGLGRLHAERLATADITTLTQLGETPPATHVPRIRPETLE
ncbi:MAG: TM0106 family RecB-like putative nuclease, partial [Gaiellaceae bacterium]